MRNRIALVSQTPKTVLTTRDLALLWQETDRDALKAAIAYSLKRGDLVRLTRGVFAKGREYDPRELATSLYAPSYISFETALREAGVLFQHADTLFVAGPWSKAVTIGRTRIRFRRLKDAVLFNPSGIENRGTYSIASPERAFLDMLRS